MLYGDQYEGTQMNPPKKVMKAGVVEERRAVRQVLSAFKVLTEL